MNANGILFFAIWNSSATKQQLRDSSGLGLCGHERSDSSWRYRYPEQPEQKKQRLWQSFTHKPTTSRENKRSCRTTIWIELNSQIWAIGKLYSVDMSSEADLELELWNCGLLLLLENRRGISEIFMQMAPINYQQLVDCLIREKKRIRWTTTES